MRIHRLGGWFLIVFALAQGFQAISLAATTKNTPGPSFVLIISLMLTGGAVLLWREGQLQGKA